MFNKATSSEVFDNFTKTMRRYNIKKKANWFTSALDLISDSAKPLNEVLSDLGKSSDDFIVEAYKSGFTPEEIAKYVPGTTVDSIKKLVAKSMPEVATETAKNIGEASKATGELGNNITESYNNIVSSGTNVLNLFERSKDLTNKTPEEVISLYEGLKRSRNSLKGSVTKLKNELAQAQEAAQISAEELAKKNKAVLQGEALLGKSEEQVSILGVKITELGGQLDEAGNVIKGLEEQLTSTKQELDLAQQALTQLSQEGIALAAENKRLLDSALEKSELAGYYKALHEALVNAGQGNTVAGKAAGVAATQAQTQATQAVQTITQATPAAAPTITKATTTATTQGTAKAKKAINPTATPTPTANPSANAPASASPTPSPNAAAATPAAPASKATPTPTPTATPAKAAPTAKQTKTKMKDRLQNLILAGKIGAAVAPPILKVLGFAAIIGLVGGGAYYLWNNYLKSNPEIISKNINDTIQSEYDAINSLKALRFNKGSSGEAATQDLIDNISASIPYVSKLNSGEISQEELEQTMGGLDHLNQSIDSYIQNQEIIAKDLVSPNGFDQAIGSLELLKSNTQNIKQDILNAMSSAEATSTQEGVSSIPERGITEPIARPAPSIEEPKKPGHIPQVIQVRGENIDIGNLSPGMRSAAPRIAQLLETPEGLAFIDPDGVWGGWLPKTPITNDKGEVSQDKNKDYLRALKYLYLNKIFDRQDLRKFMRQNLPKEGRKRMSGWNNAVKYYVGGQKTATNQENNNFFTQKLTKPANNNTSSVISDNRIVLNMRKKADQFSKEYFQEAVSGLEDQYAKSYYAGLKGMYDQKLSGTEADYRSLYEVHNESGNTLIGSAHPETINIADAMANGGVVENVIEQQRHHKGVAKSMPSGNFRNRNAWVVQNLVKLADQVDEQGLKEASDLIDAVLKELTS